MASNQTWFKLNTGAKIPAIGFGTWQDADAQAKAVEIALKAGYRHIDTARIYGTEKAVGQGMKDSGVPRDEIFITTKLWNNAHHPEDVEKQLDASLTDLGVESIDLWLMHWPSPFKRGETLMPKDDNGVMQKGDTDYVDTYKSMEKCLEKGKVKAIGVSNFSKAELERLLKETTVVSITSTNHPHQVPTTNIPLPRSPQSTKLSSTPGSSKKTSQPSTNRRASTSSHTPPSATKTTSTTRARTWAS